MGVELSPELGRYIANAGIMVAASAFVATVNADLFTSEKPEAKTQPYTAKYTGPFAENIRISTIGLGYLLLLLLGFFCAMSFEPAREFFINSLHPPRVFDSVGLANALLVAQVIYYIVLALMFTLCCHLRSNHFNTRTRKVAATTRQVQA